MKEYTTLVTEDRRLAILRLLSEEGDYAINDSVLQTALEQLGHGESRAVVRTDLAFLQEVGLLTVDVVVGGVHVARLNGRGADVAAGRAVVPGVKRPAPGE